MNWQDNLNPYIYYIVAVQDFERPYPDKSFPKRTTVFHEMEWISKGTGQMWTDGNCLPVKQGDFLYRPPGTSVHAFGEYHCYLMVFEPFIHEKRIFEMTSLFRRNENIFGNHLAKEQVQAEAPLPFPGQMAFVNQKEYELLFTEILLEYSKNEASLGLKIKAMELMNQVQKDTEKCSRFVGSQISAKRHFDQIIFIQKKIDQNPSEKLTLKELAERVGVSPNHFCRLFKQLTGENLMVYQMKAKLNKGKNLLITTNETIEWIARVSGFETVTYFYRAFKRMMHMTPNRYREQYKVY